VEAKTKGIPPVESDSSEEDEITNGALAPKAKAQAVQVRSGAVRPVSLSSHRDLGLLLMMMMMVMMMMVMMMIGDEW